ncbi:Ribosomal lysine N-methyltransferase 4 [Sporothrix epigloea]|uniref:N-lysine methyltransferase SETD6 n=1 Tax=Sporothrix epigloea TaxID=1892477 RepID=A0ABP0E2G3_9PEZI
MDDFMQPARAFLDWFSAWPGTTFHDDIEIVDLRDRGAGRGIVAKRDIPVDTVLFTIPRKAIISTTTSELGTLLPSIVQVPDDQNEDEDDEEKDVESPSEQDAWTSLILVMIYEFLRGSQSPWKPYFDVLPAVFDTPMFWTDDELRELQASPVVGRVGHAEADKMIRIKVLAFMRIYSNIFFGRTGVPTLGDDEIMELAHRMGSTIMAYSFSLEKDEDDEGSGSAAKTEEQEDVEMDDGNDVANERQNGEEHKHGPDCDHDHGHDSDDDSDNDLSGWVEDKDDKLPLGMVPMADMLNADAECNAHIAHGVDVLTATAIRPIRAGDEILNYYGPLSNGELLRRYGYTTEKHAFFDAVDVPWPLLQNSLAKQLQLQPAEAAKAAAAAEADEFEDPFMLDREFDEDEETGQLKAPEGCTSSTMLSELPPMLVRQARAFIKVALRQQQKRREKALASAPKSKQTGKNGKNSKSQTPPKTEKELVAAGLAHALKERLDQYPTSLQQDRELLASGSVAPGSRLHSALRVRIGEKGLLTEAIALAKKMEVDARDEAKAAAKADKDASKTKKSERRGDDDNQASGKRQKR